MLGFIIEQWDENVVQGPVKSRVEVPRSKAARTVFL